MQIMKNNFILEFGLKDGKEISRIPISSDTAYIESFGGGLKLVNSVSDGNSSVAGVIVKKRGFLISGLCETLNQNGFGVTIQKIKPGGFFHIGRSAYYLKRTLNKKTKKIILFSIAALIAVFTVASTIKFYSNKTNLSTKNKTEKKTQDIAEKEKLLTEIEKYAAEGDMAQAQASIALLAEKYPDAPEIALFTGKERDLISERTEEVDMEKQALLDKLLFSAKQKKENGDLAGTLLDFKEADKISTGLAVPPPSTAGIKNEISEIENALKQKNQPVTAELDGLYSLMAGMDGKTSLPYLAKAHELLSGIMEELSVLSDGEKYKELHQKLAAGIAQGLLAKARTLDSMKECGKSLTVYQDIISLPAIDSLPEQIEAQRAIAECHNLP